MEGNTDKTNERLLVTIIIPTKNAAKNIAECLGSIERSTYHPYEVIVVDGLSKDSTADIARRLDAKVVEGTAKGRASDSNLGIAQAKGEIVAFTDDDCVVDEHWLERIVACFDDPNVGIAGGPDLTYAVNASPIEMVGGHIHYFYRSLASKGGADAIIGCNSAYRKSCLLKVGGFDDSWGRHIAEDTELHRRIIALGYTVKQDPDCIVYHRRRPTLSALIRKYWGDGNTMGMVHRRKPAVFQERCKHIYPLIGGIAFLPVMLILGVLFPPIWLGILALGFAYLLFMAVLHRYLARRTHQTSPFFLFFITATLSMLAYGIAFSRQQIMYHK